MNTKILSPDQADEAVALLKKGEIVALPTETVYGLAADASNDHAVSKIFTAKGRPADHPLIVHIDSFYRIFDWADSVPAIAQKLADHFWPGPLTLIVHKKQSVSLTVTGGLSTVALRVPNHPIMLEIIRKVGVGLAAPSANAHKKTSPTTARHVLRTLSGKIAAVVDGGSCDIGLESTIVDLTKESPVIVRPGVITASMIEKVVGVPVAQHGELTGKVPGGMHVHYQTEKPLCVISVSDLEKEIDAHDGAIAVMHYSSLSKKNHATYYLMPNNKSQYATMLYQTLHHIDSTNVKKIVVEAPPIVSEWADINDRLEKARSK